MAAAVHLDLRCLLVIWCNVALHSFVPLWFHHITIGLYYSVMKMNRNSFTQNIVISTPSMVTLAWMVHVKLGFQLNSLRCAVVFVK